MKREKKHKIVIHVHILEKHAALLLAQAEQEDRSVSAVVRRMIEAYYGADLKENG